LCRGREGDTGLDSETLRVMSFNVRGSFRDAGRRQACWPSRAAENVAVIERHAPHLVCLQECQRGNLLTYRKRLPRYEQVEGPPYGNAPPHDFNAILFDPTRVELLERGGFWLSETPGRRSQSWETRVARSANWALFGTRGGLVLHLNTHLDHKSGLARRNGSTLIVKTVEGLIQDIRPGTPAVLTGDFNCRPGTPTYEIFARAGFADTFLAAGNKDEDGANTFHAFKGNAYRDPHPERGPRRIDWVLLKDPSDRLDVVSHDILRDGADFPPYPSDHHPVLATFAQTGQR
jgi:endonuclease/exonuclease/phosphatase family metal-dependent hydrolase